MGLFDHFPYTNVHELNLDWLLTMMKALEAEWEAFTAGNSLTFADPLQHDISKTYAKNTIVLDDTGNAYVSLQAVPVGVALDNQDYWLMVFDYEAFIEKVNKNFTARYYRGNYRATAAMVIGDWLTVDDVLCKAIAAIAIDDVLEVGVNIKHFTLEDFIKAFMQSANQLIQQYKNDIDASELSYRNQLAQDIADTTASLQAQLDAAISGTTVDSEVILARVGANNYTYSTLGDAIRQQIADIVTSLKSNALDPLTLIPKIGDSMSGISFTFNSMNELTVSGTSTAAAFIDLWDPVDGIPPFFTAGNTYYADYTSNNTNLRIYSLDANNVETNILNARLPRQFTVPSDCVGLRIRFYVGSGQTVSETVQPHIYDMSAPSNKYIKDHLFNGTTLVAGTDFDTINDIGVYTLARAATYLNSPKTAYTRASLIVLHELEIISGGVQILLDWSNGVSYFRQYYDGAWQNWTRCDNLLNNNVKCNDNVECVGYRANTISTTVEAGTGTLNRIIQVDNDYPTTGTEGRWSCTGNTTYALDSLLECDIPVDGYYLFRVYFYYNGVNVGYQTIGFDQNGFTTPANCDSFNIAINLVLNAAPLVDTTYTFKYMYNVVKPLEILKQKAAPLSVCTYNVGLYHYGGGSMANGSIKNELIRHFICENDIDIICSQENNNEATVGANGAYSAYKEYYPSFNNGPFSLIIASKFKFCGKSEGYFTDYDENQRGYQLTHFIYNGVPITLFNCHLTPGNNATCHTIRQNQKAEMLSWLAPFENVILCGDWNAYDYSEYSDLISAGYTPLNGGYLSVVNTQPTIGTASYPMDNILIKGDHIKGGAYLLPALYDQSHEGDRDYYVSDHYPVVAHINII